MPTKPDETRQAPRFKPLSPAQEMALTLYLAGLSDTDVAQAVGVTRQTCWQWRRQHPVFMVELERRRAEVWRQP
jgi:transposase-like protein